VSIFIDSGIFIAFHNRRDTRHEQAVQLIRRIISGELGSAYTSTYVFDEAVTFALMKTGRREVALSVGQMILGESTYPFVNLLRVERKIFEKAWKLFAKYADKHLSFTDCTSIALIEHHGIDAIASFDSDFDGITPRIF